MYYIFGWYYIFGCDTLSHVAHSISPEYEHDFMSELGTLKQEQLFLSKDNFETYCKAVLLKNIEDLLVCINNKAAWTADIVTGYKV